MDIKTHVRKDNVKEAEKILRKGRGAWGEFVNGAFQVQKEIDKLADYFLKSRPNDIQEGSAVDNAIRLLKDNQ